MTCESQPAGPPRAGSLRGDQVLGALMRRLLDQVEFLVLFWDGAAFSLDLTTRSGERRRSHDPRPLKLLLGAVGGSALKTCKGPCRREKPLGQFSEDRNNEDGLLRRCKTCEAYRVALYKRRKRLRRKAEAEDAAGGA